MLKHNKIIDTITKIEETNFNKILRHLQFNFLRINENITHETKILTLLFKNTLYKYRTVERMTKIVAQKKKNSSPYSKQE